MAVNVAGISDPIAVAHGGTGATAITGAREALGLLSTGSSLFETAAMRRWRAAWAARKSLPCNALVLSNSNGVGYYGSAIADPWVRVMANMLAVAAGFTVDAGYVTQHSLTNYLNTWTTSGTVTEFSTSGLGYAAVSPAANGGYIEIARVCDRFWVLFTAGTLIGKYGVQINGGSSINVAAIAGTIAGGYAWDSGPLTLQSNTVRLTATDATFAPRLEGVRFFNGNANSSGSQGLLSASNSLTGVGPRVWNGSKFGTKASDFAATSATTWWTDSLTVVNPDLVDVCFGTNELTSGQTTTQLKTYYGTLVSRISTVMSNLGRPTPSYRFHVPHGTGATDAAFLPYRTAIIEAAVTNGAAILDIYGLTGFVGTPAADTHSFTSSIDGSNRVHLSTMGHRAVGEASGGHLLAAGGLAVGAA